MKFGFIRGSKLFGIGSKHKACFNAGEQKQVSFHMGQEDCLFWKTALVSAVGLPSVDMKGGWEGVRGDVELDIMLS